MEFAVAKEFALPRARNNPLRYPTVDKTMENILNHEKLYKKH